MNRRAFIVAAASWGATAAWGWPAPRSSQTAWHERRQLFPEGVASGDPDSNSVLFWTRYPSSGKQAQLTLEVAEDELFERVTASTPVTVSAEADWTCRVLVGGLKPARVYWYRFSDSDGNGSRIGRTVTAPDNDDSRSVRFAFVSCQNANQGAQNAYRRMIFEDLRASESERLDFVLHLGDFIYEIVWYPEDRPQGMYDRKLRDIVRYGHGEKIHDFHIPTTLDDYRAVYRAYLHDPDLQDARARWPFVCMWDNHEYSWLGWQGLQVFDGKVRPAQTRKVAANQAWFEYQPARISKPSGTRLEEFKPPKVVDAPIEKFDEHGLGQEPNNLTAINSLVGYRALRWGRNVELIITDQRSYRSEEPSGLPGAEKFSSDDFPFFTSEEALKILDAGRAYNKTTRPSRFASARTKWRILGATRLRKPSWARNKRSGSSRNCAPPKRLGRFGGTRSGPWRCAPICKTCPGLSRSRGPRRDTLVRPTGIGRVPMPSARRFTMPCSEPASLDLRSWPAIATAFGRAWPPKRFRPIGSSRLE